MTPSSQTHVAVLGLGAWGAALALHCARQGHSVTGWQRNAALADTAQSSRTLSHLGNSIRLPENFLVTSDLEKCASADVTIIALPAKAWNEVIRGLSFRIAVSATKGLESTSGLTPLRFLERECGFSAEQLAVISGPSFASDLAAARPLSLVSASQSKGTALRVAELLASPALRVYTSEDPVGVELGGTLKNIIAIAAGVSDSLGFGPSARAALISRGLAEMMRLATSMGAHQKTLAGLSGLGDLIMTATEDQSRNRMVGIRLGKGEPLSQILNTLGSTAEGVNTAPLVQRIAKDSGVEVPITDHVVALLNASMSPAEVVQGLMKRPLKSEF